MKYFRNEEKSMELFNTHRQKHADTSPGKRCVRLRIDGRRNEVLGKHDYSDEVIELFMQYDPSTSHCEASLIIFNRL